MSTQPPISLMERASVRMRGGDWRVGAAVAGVLVSIPLAVVAVATLLAIGTEDRTAARTGKEAVALARVAEAARLRQALARPAVGATLEALARALPAEARLRRVARGAEGALIVEVATADPDRLRAALRREPLTARLRDVGQQGGPAGLIVTLEDRS